MTEENKSQKIPALLSVIKEEWLEDAFEYFQNSGKDKLYFWSNSKHLKKAGSLCIKQVYFKTNDIFLKEFLVITKADFIEITTKNPIEYRLPSYESEEGLYYYGFSNLRKLENPVELTELQNYNTKKYLLNSTPGATIIIDPKIE